MTARSAGTPQVLYRVACPSCNWMGVRGKPTARNCPWCGGPGERIQTWWQVGRADQSSVYIVHFHWPEGVVRDPTERDWLIFPDGRRIKFHADHYSGSSCQLDRRLTAHLSSQGAKLVAAAIALGAEVRIARVWHVPLAFEQRLRQPPQHSTSKRENTRYSSSPQSDNGRRYGAKKSLRPLCPEPGCAGEAAWRRYPEAEVQAFYQQLRRENKAKKEARRAWDDHCAQLQADGTWDPWETWDEAFPDRAFGVAPAEATA
jgi:hypothetical protein